MIRAEARTDLREILRYGIREHGRPTAERYLRGIDKTFLLARNHPNIGSLCTDLKQPLRSLPHGRHRIYYQSDQQTISIVRVLHQSMDAARQFD